MTNPKVSIIIPVYNVADYLDKCLQSVIDQTLQEIEIIVVNDGSTDHSMAVIKKYCKKDKRITLIDQENTGVVAARNNGIANASGEYLFFLDGDDFLGISSLELMYTNALEYSSDIVISDFYYIYLTTNFVKPWYNENFEVIDNLQLLKLILTNKCTPSIWGKLYRSNLFTNYEINVPVDFSYGEDVLAIIQLSYYARTISKVNAFSVYYVQRETSITKRNLTHKGLDNLNKLPFYIQDFLTKKKCLGQVNKELDMFFVNNFKWTIAAKGYKNAKIKAGIILEKIESNSELKSNIEFRDYLTIYSFSKSQSFGKLIQKLIPKIERIIKLFNQKIAQYQGN